MIERWLRFWFALPDTRPLELVRIGLGFALFISYLLMAGHVAEFYSDAGWLPMDRAEFLRERSSLSILYYVTSPWAVRCLWAVLLAALAALGLGWRTAWTKWVVLVLHVSFANRGPMITYGFDHITGILLLLVCIAPVGQALALDTGRRTPTKVDQARRSASLRLVQIQMAIIFFFAGAEKLRGQTWWDGDAIWYALADQEFQGLPLVFFAENMWLVNALTYLSIIIELGYAFLIWGRKTRPIFLLGALGLHAGIAAMLSLVLFAFGMAVGHLAFVPSHWIDRFDRRR